MWITNFRKIFCEASYQKIILTNEQCDRLIKYFEANVDKSFPSKINKNQETKTTIRSSTSLFFDDNGIDFQDILTIIGDYVCDVNNQAWGFDIGNFIKGFQIIKYEARADHYDWHMDWNPDPMSSKRKISVVVQLSNPEDYKGCQLVLKCGNAEVYFEQTRGNAIFFPSFYLHRVMPLESGIRYSLVFWIEGNSFI